MSTSVKASVIIILYNGLKFIDRCLRSVLAQAGLNFEVLVVDNASTDGSPEHVARHFPAVTLIRSPENLGYAGGINLGLQHARDADRDDRHVDPG